MHPPINVHINFHFKQKHITLQDISVKGLPMNVITIAPITKNFQYHNFIQESNISKKFNINFYKLQLKTPSFYLIDFKAQGQTFEHLVINLHQPLDSVQLNMHNIYVTLSCLDFKNGLVILQDIITIQDIRKVHFKNKSLEMTTIFVILDIEKTVIPKCHKGRSKCNIKRVKLKWQHY
jgi:hypothetical protein